VNRRQFVFGTLATSLVGLAACEDPKPVVKTTPLAPSPSASAAVVKSNLPPIEPATMVSNQRNAIIASDEMLNYFAKVLDTPSNLIHAVRAFGKNFKRGDGSNTVDYLCSTYGETVKVGGKSYIKFKRPNVEVHDNSFLKTFLEAGVPATQPITIGSTKYTLQDLGEHAKSLFRFDTSDISKYDTNYAHDHLPWGLIALSTLNPGGKASWTNAYNETVVLANVIDKALFEYESKCEMTKETQAKGEEIPRAFLDEEEKFACFGGHTIYGFLSCLKNGYTDQNLKSRIQAVIKHTVYLAANNANILETKYRTLGKGPISPDPKEEAMLAANMQKNGITKDEVIEMLTQRALIKLEGHMFESINYAKLHKLYQPTAQDIKYIQAGEQRLYDAIVKFRSLKLEQLKNFEPKQMGDAMIAVAHGARAMKLLTPENPDTNPKTI
jgi:hypothetical protein